MPIGLCRQCHRGESGFGISAKIATSCDATMREGRVLGLALPEDLFGPEHPTTTTLDEVTRAAIASVFGRFE
jgi:hypothetical protein